MNVNRAKPAHPASSSHHLPSAKAEHGWKQRVADSVGELERVAREILAAEQKLAPEAKVDAVELPVVLGFHGGESRLAGEFRLAEGEKLVELLRGRVRDALLNAVAFERGRVYCLRCENSLCPHSSPPTPRSVFSGYEETGRPEWIEFDKLLHRRSDPRLDRLYGGRDVVALAIHRDELYGRLLEGFDAPKWRCYVVGQLCVGYFAPSDPDGRPPERRRHDRSEVMALTIQVVRTQKPPDGALLGLNLIGRRPEPALAAAGATAGAAPTPLEETILEGLHDALARMRREIGVFSGRGGTRVPGIGIAFERLTNRVAQLLRDASRDLEHRTRIDGRRTGHARDRARQGDRPTHKAFEDARHAGDDDLGWDVQEETVVVRGPSNRIHFFRLDGKHVTSVVFPAHVVEQRVGQKRWAPLDQEKRESFRRAVATP